MLGIQHLGKMDYRFHQLLIFMVSFLMCSIKLRTIILLPLKRGPFCEHFYQNKYFIIYLIVVLCYNMWFLGMDSFPVEGIAVSQWQSQTRTLDCSWDSWSSGSHCVAVCVWTIRRSSQQQSCPPNFLWCFLHLRIFFF